MSDDKELKNLRLFCLLHGNKVTSKKAVRMLKTSVKKEYTLFATKKFTAAVCHMAASSSSSSSSFSTHKKHKKTELLPFNFPVLFENQIWLQILASASVYMHKRASEAKYTYFVQILIN